MSFKKKNAARCGYIAMGIFIFSPICAFAKNVTYREVVGAFHNLPINSQLEAINLANGAIIKQAKAMPNPEISISAENFAGSKNYKGINATETTIQVSQDLQLFGRNNVNVEYATLVAASSRFEISVKKQEFARSVAMAWLDVEFNDANLKLANDKLKNAAEDLNIVSLLYLGGRESLLRKMQAQNDFDMAEAEKSKAESELRLSKALLQSMSQMAIKFDGIMPEFLDKKLKNSNFEINNNPKYLLLKSIANANNAAIKIAKIENKPNANAYFGARHFAQNGDFAMVGGVSFSVPIGNKNQAIIEQKNAEFNSANFAIDNFIREVEGQRLELSTKIVSSNRDIAKFSQTVSSAQKIYELSKIGFKAGKIPLSEVQSARNIIFDAKQNILNSKRNLAIAQIDMASLQGNLIIGGHYE